ncbi:hypoxanthine phosphoribosyltransferase [Geoalkalibacter halelectricus]|uniref:Hypoxanthine phosphoribosyltransferase n=1 Tax=Geoalkalibacter halelectricus TaxID=2847045 RepID=A0ABY5ZKK2_9BACT|nr:hypoxanthine phosphoribosyltransferase [Geoalkalibacter halelectricus]MDO3380152.1 hypoxanthine phosphoribosyltransferase [Geoalkalibacter halelectricus]UWZ78274.1 hypoxanthine phosphoribosyltransferase [Geoalkalibacter halelectricus]
MIDLKMDLLYSRERISTEITRLAREIDRDYQGQDVLLVAVLKGSLVFVADLLRALKVNAAVDFVRLASYGSEMQSSGIVEFRYNLETPIRDRNVLIVEDIVDSGYTLQALYNKLLIQKPRTLRICTLLDKRARREVDIEADYIGISMDDGFVVGYGLDYKEKYRQLADIYLVKP